ncbi:MAG TPA: sucrase ferredoxin, partial [Symbiobacteriaceae bacterium]|nr:sucrase ferredoxin [Symbiobacteriaceae bacterium]
MCDCFAERFCSLVSRAVGEDPGGTATHYRQYILVELPLPWPKDPTQAEAFPHGLERVMSAAPGAKARLLFIAPDAEYSRAGQARVISFRRPSDGLVAGFDREEHLVPVGQVAALAEALLQGSVGVGQRPAIRDMLVCTHGSTDAACGRFGYPLYETLRRRYAGPGLRVWRVSHIGGHRFAPTLLDFPEGRCW